MSRKSCDALTTHEIEHIVLFICPVQPKRLDAACENWVYLDPVEDVEAAIQILVLAKVQVDCMKYETDGDVPVKC